MADTLSNHINDRVCPDHYQYDPTRVVIYDYIANTIDLPEVRCKSTWRVITERPRRPQTTELLQRLAGALTPCRHTDWLAARGITDVSKIYGIDHAALSRQDLIDLHIYPGDHILDDYGERPIDGPVFPDERNGNLVGVCVRNTSTDLEYVRDAKYTFSNYGWYLYGYDLYDGNTDIMLVEGVFDAIAMRHFGYAAIAIGACAPHPFQLACLAHKFKSVTICLDNDFWGHYSAYGAAKMLRSRICLPELKDVSYHFESGVPLKLNEIGSDDLRDLLLVEIADYNRKMDAGVKLVRDLRYNQPR